MVTSTDARVPVRVRERMKTARWEEAVGLVGDEGTEAEWWRRLGEWADALNHRE